MKTKLVYVQIIIVLILLEKDMGTTGLKIIDQYSCNFDGNLCNWSHDRSMSMLWKMTNQRTPSPNTGPSKDASGIGSYLYIEASTRKHGERARIISPVIQGPHCMTFMYHMNGKTMGTIIVYLKTSGTLRPVWIKSRNQSNKWWKANVYLNNQQKYQVVIEGIVGADWSSDAAIDELTFTKGRCQQFSSRLVHVYFKVDTSSFKVDTLPPYDDWIYDFSFTAKQTLNNTDDVLYFMYPDSVCSDKVLTTKFSVSDLNCIPIEFIYASQRNESGQSKILLIDRRNGLSPQQITLETDRTCCEETARRFFYAKVVKYEASNCFPGWSNTGIACIRLITIRRNLMYSHATCLWRGSNLATPTTLRAFNQLRQYLSYFQFMGYNLWDRAFYIGVTASDGYQWTWMNNQQATPGILPNKNNNAIGKCGILLKDQTTNQWRIKDELCLSKLPSYLCMKNANFSLQCGRGWILVNATCFEFNVDVVHKTWYGARFECRNKNSLLAVLDSVHLLKGLGAKLDAKLTSKDIRIFVGLKYVAEFRWTSGEPIPKSLWYPAHPDEFASADYNCAAIKTSNLGWRLFQVKCNNLKSLICQKDERNFAYQKPARTKYPTFFGDASLATDGNYATCLETRMEKDPWLEVDLGKQVFVKKIVITNRKDCCLRANTKLQVMLGRKESTIEQCSMYKNVYTSKSTVFVCSLNIETRYVTIQALGITYLTLCEVMVIGSENKENFKGVLQEIWKGVSSYSVDKLYSDDRFPSQPDTVRTIKDFDAPRYGLPSYGQRLTGYLQVPVSGKYIFYAACNDACELWIDNYTESTLKEGKTSKQLEPTAEMIVKLNYKNYVRHNEWDRYPDQQTSRSIFLSKCNLYKLEMLMKQDYSSDCASAGMQLPNGTFERPIPRKRLHFVRPGYRNISFKFVAYNGNKIIAVASNQLINIKASYKYCCHGVYCPNCPVKVYLQFDETTLLVNESLLMNCNSQMFEFKIRTKRQPQSYPIKISYIFIDEPTSKANEITVGQLLIKAKTIFQCNYTKDTCLWKNGDKKMENNQWNLTRANDGYFLSLNNLHTSAWLESNWIVSDKVASALGWCLTFSFLLPSLTSSQLQVILKTTENNNGSVVWNLMGLQNKDWSSGQVFWKSTENVKIVFVGKSSMVNGLGVGIDSVTLVTSMCVRLPVHSKPGYKCNNKTEFQCANGQCIAKDLVCDGDAFCIDGSDEKNCKCFSHQFSCSDGECIEASQLCNGKKDCTDGSDESLCKELRCSKTSFQCLSGSCIPWSQTCDGKHQCEDEADEPGICGSSTDCPINNMSCSAWDNATLGVECASSKVHCDFEKVCLSHDIKGQFQWQIRSGSTPTKKTGPSFDHTTLNNTGKYIYIEASDKNPGDKALLLSDYLKSGQPVCVRFWYNMRGIHIGTLNIYSKLNNSKQLLWSRSGNKGENWLYGQTGLNSTETFRILIEGVTNSGALGDIAMDDLTISYDNCTTLDDEGRLQCTFEQNTCGWTPTHGWTLSIFGNRPLASDWQGTKGGYLYLSSAHVGSWESITSPVITLNHHIACVKLWYHIHIGRTLGSEIRLSIKTKNISKRLWRSTTETSLWQYLQIPLTSQSEFQLVIEGRKTTASSNLLLDDITLSKESCDRIPRTEPYNRYSSYRAIRYWKLDGTDRDVRSFGSIIHKEDNGRMVTCFDGKTTHLETPAVDFHTRSFTISCWVKVKDPGLMGHIYSDWSHPFQFRLYAYQESLVAILRGSGGLHNLVHLSMLIPSGKWTYTGLSWNRKTRTAILYRDTYYKTLVVNRNIKNIDIRVTNHTFYEIGFKKDSKQRFRGCLRDLTVFDRALNPGEMQFKYHPSRTLCPVRQTTSGDCCVFPFILGGKSYRNCVYGVYVIWCSTTSNYDRDRKWGTCKVDNECDTVEDGWCGWKTVSNDSIPWKRKKDYDMRNMKMEVDQMLSNASWKYSIEDTTNNYEVHFPKGHNDYINITNLPDMTRFTICMWVRTDDKSSGTPFIYRVRYKEIGRDVLAIGLVDYTGVTIFIGESRSVKSKTRFNDGKWNHVCLRWISEAGIMHINVNKLYSSSGVYAKNEIIPGKGEFIIGVTSSYAKLVGEGVGQFIGDISDLNIWNWFLSNEDVNLMSVGCGIKIVLPRISWDHFVGHPIIRRPATCKDSKGPRVLLKTFNRDGSATTASTFESLLFRRSSNHYGLCLRFVYLIYGPVENELLVYQHLKVDNYTARLVWAVNESKSTNTWRYGRASISGVSSYKLYFKSNSGSLPGYIAIKGIQVINGYCASKPTQSHKVNSEKRTSPHGYIHSPFFPGYYGPTSTYRWQIVVDPKNIIRLYFLSFNLEDHPACTNDYVSVYNMNLKTRIGTYCGSRCPNFLDSAGNIMIVIFRSDSKVQRQGFKLFYVSKPGCPLGCDCSSFSSNNKWLVIKSLENSILSTIPSNIPQQAKVLLLGSNRIYRVLRSDFPPSASNLEYIDLSNNIVANIQTRALENLRSLKVMRMNTNLLRSIPAHLFPQSNQLTTLDLSSNLLTTIEPPLLNPLTSLKILSLRSNKIAFLNEKVFQNNSNLTTLFLNFNNLQNVPDLLFSQLQQLKILYLNDNKIKKFTSSMFNGLNTLEKLYLHNNHPLEFSPGIFATLSNLKELHVDGFFLCCYAKKAIPDVRCISPKDFFSSCSDLMKNKALQIFIWILGLSALLGNVFVVILRAIVKEDNKVHSFFLTNLAIADFLMGVYMLIIAIKDVEFQGEYFKHDLSWRTGNICKLAGGLSLLSSEVSVLLLTLITADRVKSIVFPFRFGKLSYKSACLLVAMIWIIGIILSVIPMVNLSYFFDEKRQVGYYGRSALCLPLQLSRDKLAGWEYSVAIFIVMNLISFVFIAVSYAVIFITVQRSSRSIRSTSIKRESQMAKKMAFIIATDFCCWMPVIIIGILSLLDLFHDPEQQVYAWLAVFVLPVNSSINPILYTFSTSLYMEILKKKKSSTSTTKCNPSNETNSSIQMCDKASSLNRPITVQTHPKKYSKTDSRNKTRECMTEQKKTQNIKMDSTFKQKNNSKRLAFSNAVINDNAPDEIQEDLAFGFDPDIKLKVIEVPNIFVEEITQRVGFLVVSSKKPSNESCLHLIKYMPLTDCSYWLKEASIASFLATANPKHIVKYCWHAKGDQLTIECEEKYIQNLQETSLFLCYEFVSSTTLDDILQDDTAPLSFDSACVIVIDILDALQELYQHSIVHNSISLSNILIRKCKSFPPLRAVLGGLSKAEIADQDKKEIQLGENVRQFGAILETLVHQYKILDKTNEIDKVIELCRDIAVITHPKELKDIIMDILNYQDNWNTLL